MDLNQLLFHHQVALMRDLRPRGAHGPASLAGHYARRIERMRRLLGAVPWPSGPAEPLRRPAQAFG